jgi:hypothetical protein
MKNAAISLREHRELGDVAWMRDHDHATTLAATQGKPVLLLFQEVPGCSTCIHFGQDVLTHPLMVEFIAEHFVPLAIFNNHPGADAEVLRHYGERSWNNPVVRFLRPDGTELLPRMADRYDPLGLHGKLSEALEVLGREVPEYFRLLRRDLLIEQGLAKNATYLTPCFWSGETSLAQHPGVLTTDAGWIAGEEAVKVQFDPAVVTRSDLDAFARIEGFTPIMDGRFCLDREPQFYLRKNTARHLPLSAAQRTRINLAVPYQEPIDNFLSPQQRAWYADPRLLRAADEDTYHQDIRVSWPLLKSQLASPHTAA